MAKSSVRHRDRKKPGHLKKIRIAQFIYKQLIEKKCPDLKWINDRLGFFQLKLDHGSSTHVKNWPKIAEKEHDFLYMRWGRERNKINDKTGRMRSRKDLKHLTSRAMAASQELIKSQKELHSIEFKFTEEFMANQAESIKSFIQSNNKKTVNRKSAISKVVKRKSVKNTSVRCKKNAKKTTWFKGGKEISDPQGAPFSSQ